MATDDAGARVARLAAFAQEGEIQWPDEPGVTLREFGPCFRGTAIGLFMLGEYDDEASIHIDYALTPAQVAAGRDYWERHAALFEAECWRDYMDNDAFPSPEGEQRERLQSDIRHLLAERDALLARCTAAEAALVEERAMKMRYINPHTPPQGYEGLAREQLRSEGKLPREEDAG